MIDKADVKIPYSASFRPEFRFVPDELRYAGFGSRIKRSQYYQGVIDLRPFGFDAILHAYFRRRGRQNHKLELIDTGEKSLEQMAQIISGVFAVDPNNLEMMRVDLAADLYGIPLLHLYESVRVKLKRSACAIGERDFEIIGKQRLEYFRYGRSPNCVRVYDKIAECMARMPELLKHVSRDAEDPTFQDLFGFPETATVSRIERQAGGGRLPDELSKFGQLARAAEFDPFGNVEILRGKIPFPDPALIGTARSLKIAGIAAFVNRYGYQQSRAMLNGGRNAKRIFDALDSYLFDMKACTELTRDSILDSYRRSVQSQIDGSIENRRRHVPESKSGFQSPEVLHACES